MNPSSTPFSSPKYRPDIDGLRAMAVLSVVAFHAFPAWIRGGFIGVDIFFVISGFLISTIIFENLEKGTFSFREFYARRIKRIFPALILVLTACFVFGWFTLLADEYQQLGKHMAAGAGFISNFVLWSEVGYFDNSADTKPLLHLWSLGIEEQFYMLWPLVLWAAWKRKFNLLSIAILFFIVSFVLNIKGVKTDPTTTFYLPHTRFWELLAGSILAWFHVYRQKPPSTITLKLDRSLASILYRHPVDSNGDTLRNLASFLGFALLLFGFWRIHQDIGFPGKWAVVPVLGAVLIILAGAQAWINRAILSNKLVVWFGLISFPLYLWHWPLLSFARIMEGETPSRTIRIAAVLIAIALAWFTYFLLEKRIRHSTKNLTTVALIILLSSTAMMGFYLNQTQAYPFGKTISTFTSDLTENIHPLSKDGWICNKSNDINKYHCNYTKENPMTVIIGDSHAAPLFSGLRKIDFFLNGGLGVAGSPACPPLLNILSHPKNTDNKWSKCDTTAQVMLESIIQDTSIKNVILTHNIPIYLSDNWYLSLTNSNLNSYNSKNSIIYSKSLENTLDTLLKNNKKVIFLYNTPTLNYHIKSCIKSRPLSITNTFNNCDITKKEHLYQNSVARTIIDPILAKRPSIIIIDLADALCDANKCYSTKDGIVMYSDTNHLSTKGAELIARFLEKQLSLQSK